MAYRQPVDRRDRSAELSTSSYLERFLDQVSSLPSTTQDTLDQIGKYDERVNALISDAENSAMATVSRSTSKGMPLENARRSYFDMIQYQKNAAELADKKISLAKNAYDIVDNIVIDIDHRLAEFEAQLKRDGRWLPHGKAPVSSRLAPTNQRQDRPVAAKTPRSSQSAIDSAKKPIVPVHSLTTRTNQKSRLRDNIINTNRLSGGSTRVTNKAGSKTPIVSSSNEDDVMEDVADSSGDAADTSTVDTQVYCFCRNVSHGEMICCDGKNCPYEWFHFECVGLSEAPKGSWLCDDCKREIAKTRRKGSAARRKTIS